MPRIFKPENFFLSFFGTGFIPKAPGTFGTLAAMPIIYLIVKYQTPSIFIIPFYSTTFIFSIFLINYVQKKNNLHDPSWIVIDEVLGIIPAALFINENSLWHYIAIFTLFRIFDIAKPFPINIVDKKMKGGFGVMLDDIIAGVMTIFSYKILFFLLTKISF